MIHLMHLTAVWLLGALLLVLDGRKRWVSLIATVALAAASVLDVVLLVRMTIGLSEPYDVVTGSWPQGIGIRLHVDQLSLLFGAAAGTVCTAALWREALAGVRSRLFPALVLLLASGLHGAFFTGDLFNFYVFFELSVVSSFALASYGYGRAEVRGALIYVAVNLVGSVLFLTGVAALYHATGTLDFDQLASRIPASGKDAILPATLLFVALSIKLGLFPFHGWVPVLYSHARPTVAAVLSGALVNIGAYGLLRLGSAVFDSVRQQGSTVLITLGLLAALYGGVLAIRRRVPAELAAYLSVMHAGYIVFALGVGGAIGTVALLLTVLAGSIDKSLMFLSLTAEGPARSIPSLVASCSAAGLPLTLGFFSKTHLLQAALDSPATVVITGAFLLSAILMLASAFRFWRLARADPPDAVHPMAERVAHPIHEGAPLGLVALAGITVVLGAVAGPVIGAVQQIAAATIGGES